MALRWRDQRPFFSTKVSYIRTWKFGDKIGCPIIKERAIHYLIKLHCYWAIDIGILCAVYEGPTVGSKLRRWALDQYLWDSYNSDLRDQSVAFLSFTRSSPAFAADFIDAYLDLGKNPPQDRYEHGQCYLDIMSYMKPLANQAGNSFDIDREFPS